VRRAARQPSDGLPSVSTAAMNQPTDEADVGDEGPPLVGLARWIALGPERVFHQGFPARH